MCTFTNGFGTSLYQQQRKKIHFRKSQHHESQASNQQSGLYENKTSVNKVMFTQYSGLPQLHSLSPISSILKHASQTSALSPDSGTNRYALEPEVTQKRKAISTRRMTVEQKQQFYNRLKANKAIVIPEDELMPDALKLKQPCFSIIEEPLIKKKRRKDHQESAVDREKGTEITSKIMRMSVMNLMWSITDSQHKSLNQKFNRSTALNIKKFKGGHNEKINVQLQHSQRSHSPNKTSDAASSPKQANNFPSQYPQNMSGSFTPNAFDEVNSWSPQKEENSKTLNQKRSMDEETLGANKANSVTAHSEMMSIRHQKTSQERAIQEHNRLIEQELYFQRLHREEYERLMQQIAEQKQIEEDLKLYRKMLKPYTGNLCAKTKYKFERLQVALQNHQNSNLSSFMEHEGSTALFK